MSKKTTQEYDYIIIGAGSAGNVLAARGCPTTGWIFARRCLPRWRCLCKALLTTGATKPTLSRT